MSTPSICRLLLSHLFNFTLNTHEFCTMNPTVVYIMTSHLRFQGNFDFIRKEREKQNCRLNAPQIYDYFLQTSLIPLVVRTCLLNNSFYMWKRELFLLQRGARLSGNTRINYARRDTSGTNYTRLYQLLIMLTMYWVSVLKHFFPHKSLRDKPDCAFLFFSLPFFRLRLMFS